MLLSRSARLRLDPAISWPDFIGMSFVAGIGFTVALLVGDLSYGPNSTVHTYVKIGVLTGSLAAATIGAIILGIRNRHHQRQQGSLDNTYETQISRDEDEGVLTSTVTATQLGPDRQRWPCRLSHLRHFPS